MPKAPAPPKPGKPPKELEMVLKGVESALRTLPSVFRSDINIKGINATDVFTLGAALNAVVEEQVAENLNRLRDVWDRENDFAGCHFVRRPQTFPDLLLTRPGSEKPILGIELKSWYVLAKEGMPNFRFQVTPAVCAPQDYLVIVPWLLSEVITGGPKIYEPFICPARFAAEYRNHHWQYVKEGAGTITLSQAASPYPIKHEEINDTPVSDKGGNFGRIARTGLLNDFRKLIDAQRVHGIEARHWRNFFTAFKEVQDTAAVEATIKAMRAEKRSGKEPPLPNETELAERLRKIADLL